MKYLTTSSFVLTSLVLSGAVMAQTAAPSVPSLPVTPAAIKAYASLGYSVGGDLLVDGTYSNAGGPFTLRAGQGLQYAVGFQYQLTDRWSAQAALGYHTDRTNGDGWNFEFTRYPVEMMVHYSLNDDWRVGLGGRYSLDPKFKSLGTAEFLGTSSLNPSLGGVAEVQYMLFPSRASGNAGGLSLKLAQESFKLNGVNTLTRNGEHIAFSVFAYF